MHPRTAELIGFLDDADGALRAAYDAVPAERRAERPAPDRWSPAEIVHHLAIVERRVTQRIATPPEQARALPPEPTGDDAASLYLAADRALVDGAVAMAWTAIDVAADASLSARLRARGV